MGARARGARDRGRLRRRVPLRPRAAGGAAGAGARPRRRTWARSARRWRRRCAWAGSCSPSGWWTRSPSRRRLADAGSPTLDQLALAHLIECGDYDRHLRQARRRYRARRDALVAAVARHLPGARVTGAGRRAARDRAPAATSATAWRSMRAAASRSVGVYPLGYAYLRPRPVDDGLVLGYANLAEPAIEEGIRRLALALEERCRRPGARRTRAARSPGSGENAQRVRRRLSNARTSAVAARLGVIWPDRPLDRQQPAEFPRVGVREGARSGPAPARACGARRAPRAARARTRARSTARCGCPRRSAAGSARRSRRRRRRRPRRRGAAGGGSSCPGSRARGRPRSWASRTVGSLTWCEGQNEPTPTRSSSPAGKLHE